MTPNRRCDTCSFAESEGQLLYCRLEPPQVTITATPMHNLAGEVVLQYQTLASQPIVKGESWCSFWSMKFLLAS